MIGKDLGIGIGSLVYSKSGNAGKVVDIVDDTLVVETLNKKLKRVKLSDIQKRVEETDFFDNNRPEKSQYSPKIGDSVLVFNWTKKLWDMPAFSQLSPIQQRRERNEMNDYIANPYIPQGLERNQWRKVYWWGGEPGTITAIDKATVTVECSWPCLNGEQLTVEATLGKDYIEQVHP